MTNDVTETITIERARVELSDVVSQVQYAGERVVVTRRAKPAAAIGPGEDLQLLQQLEDERDAQAVREAVEEARTGKAPPWSEVRESLGRRHRVILNPEVMGGRAGMTQQSESR